MVDVSHGITSGTTMVKKPMELVDSACEGIIPVYKIRRDSSPDGLFTTIADVLDPVCTGTLLGNLLFLVIEPLQDFDRVVDVSPSPATSGFDGDCMGL